MPQSTRSIQTRKRDCCSPAPFVHAFGREDQARVPCPVPGLCRRFPRPRRASARPRSRVGGDVSPVGLSASPAIQCPGLTGIGHHCVDKPTDRAAREQPCSPPAADGRSTLSRTRSPSSAEQRRPPAPAAAVSATTSVSHHPQWRAPSAVDSGKLHQNSIETLAPPTAVFALEANWQDTG